jgi:hypothetical protein
VPELTVQETREGIAALLREALAPDPTETMELRLKRKALARYYRWKSRGLLAPLREAG